MMSVRTLGTSAKKKRTKTPPTTLKEPAVMPLQNPELAIALTPRIFLDVLVAQQGNIGRRSGLQFQGAVWTNAVEVGSNVIAANFPSSALAILQQNHIGILYIEDWLR